MELEQDQSEILLKSLRNVSDFCPFYTSLFLLFHTLNQLAHVHAERLRNPIERDHGDVGLWISINALEHFQVQARAQHQLALTHA